MTCFSPLKMFRSADRNDNGKRPLTNNPLKALNSHVAMRLPCGACNGCRADKRKQMALRVMHEAQMHSCNYFVTLTQDLEKRPASNSLSKRDLQLFHKRVRNRYGAGIKYFACGEMGQHGDNPHYHSILMSDAELFPDKVLWTRRGTGPVWKSDQLAELWPNGFAEITAVTVKSASYVAGYTMKKLLSPDDPSLVRLSPVDGQWHTVEPEFAAMSRRPGLGSAWFDKFEADAFPSDFLVVDGRKVKPPKYYLDKLKVRGVIDAAHARPGFVLRDQGDDASGIVKSRRSFASTAQARANSSPERLAVRGEIFSLNFKRAKRTL